jgi:hypothetical protein
MSSPIRRLLAVALVLGATVSPALAQYFGQNKITYERFDWKVYRSPHFDIHYYGPTEEFLEDLVSYAESAYLKISRDLDHELRFRIPLVLYQNHADFEQTNIILQDIPEAVGAFAEPIQNRMVLPIDLPPDKLYGLISHELVHIFQYSLFFEGNLGRTVRANPPLWIMEGMASYLAEDEDNFDRMVLRDAVVNGLLPPVQYLSQFGFLTYRFGHAVFRYIEEVHGKEGMRNFVYEYRKVLLSNNIEKAFKESLGYDTQEFDRRFTQYLRRRFFPVLLEKKAPEDYGKEIGFRKPGVFTFSPTLSPSGELVAALASPKLKLDLVILSAEDGKQVRNLTRGWTNRYQYLVAEAFAGKRDLAWSPTGDEIAVFARKENARPLFIYNAVAGRRVREIPIPGISQNASPAYAPDGRRIAFEGNRDGVVDIFELNLDTGDVRNLTQDDFFDANPWYSSDGRTLLYNRRIGEHWKIFAVDTSDPSRKTQLTFGPYSDLQPSYSRDAKTVFFSSDRSEGIFNIFSLDLATGNVRQYTDVVGGCFAPVEMAERGGDPYVVFVSYFQGTFRLFRMPLRQAEGVVEAEERVAAQVEAEPFEPPLRLTVDRDKKEPYKVSWDIDAPSITVAVANDGTILSAASVSFSDLLGDQRIFVQAYSVDTFSNIGLTYLNLKKRFNWGARVFDFRDYFIATRISGEADRQQVQRDTGLFAFVQYPFSRHYRVEGEVGVIDRSQDFISGVDQFGFPLFTRVSDRFGVARLGFVGDTTRWQRWGPFQGRRFEVSATYGKEMGSNDIPGDLMEYRADFRAYKQITRRSLFAMRLAGVYNTGDREGFYGFGGINQLRGFDYREFFGSRLAWTNLEFRFPLVDELRFPILAIQSIRGFLFMDVGAAWLSDDRWYDPRFGIIRTDLETFEIIPFKFWDSDNNRLQDGRGSYGWGFQFLFLGGLQFNWAFAQRMDYTEYRLVEDPDTGAINFRPMKGERGRKVDFYIVFDF